MILPPLVGQYVLLIKDSSVVSAIGVLDVTRVGWLTVQRVPEGLLVFGLVGVLYFVDLLSLDSVVEQPGKTADRGDDPALELSVMVCMREVQKRTASPRLLNKERPKEKTEN